MNSIKNLERLQKLHRLILNERTGSPGELASRMHLSERSIYNLIEHLKDFEASIRYDRSRRTYYYKTDFDLKVNISVQVRSNNEVTEIFQDY
jgi:transcriptional antiterminator